MSRQCYFPDGTTLADDFVPCTDSIASPCCNQRDLCLSNGYCMSVSSQPYAISRGACTDPEWAGSCSQQCQDINTDQDVWITVMQLPDNPGNEFYCCNDAEVDDNDNLACKNGNMFAIADGTVLPGVALLQNVTSFNPPKPPLTNDTTPDPEPVTCPTCSNKELTIGVGVGVPLGVLALLFLGWAIYERLRSRKLLQTVHMPTNLEYVPVSSK